LTHDVQSKGVIEIEVKITEIEKAEIQSKAYTVSKDYADIVRKLLYSYDLLKLKVERLEKDGKAFSIEKAINNKLSSNKDERLSIENLVCIALDDFSTVELAKFYLEKYELDLRYFLERRITDMFTTRITKKL
jgi:hypothetical protein